MNKPLKTSRSPTGIGSRTSGMSLKAGRQLETRPEKRENKGKKKVPVAGRVWDSFESDEEEGDEEEQADDEEEDFVPWGDVYRKGDKPMNEKIESQYDKSDNEGEEHEVDIRKAISGIHESTMVGRISTTLRNKLHFREGAKVSINLHSRGRGRGTVLGASGAKGTFEVKMEDGTTEKNVHPNDLSLFTVDDTVDTTDKSRPMIKETKPHGDMSPDPSEVSDDESRKIKDIHEITDTRQLGSSNTVLKENRITGNMLASPSSSSTRSAQSEPKECSELHESNEDSIVSTPLDKAETEPRENSLSPLGSTSPARVKTNRTLGLLKTMFQRKGSRGSNIGETTSGGENSDEYTSPQDSTAVSTSMLAPGTGSDSGIERRQTTPKSSGTDLTVREEESPEVEQTAFQGNQLKKDFDEEQGIDMSEGILEGKGESGAKHETRGRGLGRSRGLGKGQGQDLSKGWAREQCDTPSNAGTSQSPSPRSPSLATRFGMSLRGAVMGIGGRNKKMQGSDCQAPDRKAEAQTTKSEDTYSTSKDDLVDGLGLGHHRRRQKSCRHQHLRNDLTPEHDDNEEFSDGLEDTLSGTDTFASFNCSTHPDIRNLREVVDSYIGARSQMEREMSATGPDFLPQTSGLTPSAGEEGNNNAGRRKGSLSITKDLSSTAQLSGQNLPFTEALFKAGVSETLHSTKQGILLEGYLEKFSPDSIKGVRWHQRYFVLYAGTCELRYYRTHTDAAWGRIPLVERGAIPLRLVNAIEQPSDKKYKGCRFDLIVRHRGEGRFPGVHIRPGDEHRVVTTKTYKLNAPDAQQRLLWVTVIESLMKQHGWGVRGDRRRTRRAPEHGMGVLDSGPHPMQRGWGVGLGDAQSTLTKPEGAERCLDKMDGVGHPHLWEESLKRQAERPVGETISPSPGSSMMMFVEGGQHCSNEPLLKNQPGTLRLDVNGGICIPYSPQGRRGSLMTQTLSAPPPSAPQMIRTSSATWGRGQMRQSSLRADPDMYW